VSEEAARKLCADTVQRTHEENAKKWEMHEAYTARYGARKHKVLQG
jgi:hypothetical protein